MFSIKSCKRIGILGSGALASTILNEIHLHGDEHLEVIVADSQPSRVGKRLNNQPIISLDALRLHQLDAVIIGFKSSQDEYGKTKADLARTLTCPIIDPDTLFSLYPGIRGWPLLNANLAQKLLGSAEAVRERLADEESKQQYWRFYQWVCQTPGAMPATGSSNDQYFVRDLIRLNQNEVFVDCGAYTGDTLAKFLDVNAGQFLGYYGFEPDQHSFQMLAKRASEYPSELRSKIHLVNAAVSDKRGFEQFQSSGTETSSLSTQGNQHVETWDLHSYPFFVKPTFIKVDLEGGDLKAVRGMLEAAKEWRPVLCIAIYHNPKDFLDIPTLMMKSLGDYNFYTRSHNDFGLDFVLYCLPNKQHY